MLCWKCQSKKLRMTKLQFDYPVGIVKASKNKDAAQEFIDYVTKGKGKDILKKYGFTVG